MLFFIQAALFTFLFILKDIPVILPPEDELVFTERQLGQGLQPNETELPNENTGKRFFLSFFLEQVF